MRRSDQRPEVKAPPRWRFPDPARLEDDRRGSPAQRAEPLRQDASEPEDEDRTERGVLLQREERLGGRRAGLRLHLLDDEDTRAVRAWHPCPDVVPDLPRGQDGFRPSRRHRDATHVRLVQDERRVG